MNHLIQKIIMCLVIYSITSVVSSTEAKPPDKSLHTFTVQEVASFKWGKGNNQIALTKAPANNFGPPRLVIDEAGIFLYLLDSANQRILAFNTMDNSLSSIPLTSNEVDDFCVLDGKHFYLLFGQDKKIALYNRAGKILNEYPIKNKMNPISMMCHPKRGLILGAFDGHFYRFNVDTPLPYIPIGNYAVHVELHNETQGTIWLHHNDVNMTQEISIKNRQGFLKTLNLIGLDEAGNIYLSVEEELVNKGGVSYSKKIVRLLRKYTATGKLVAETELPYSVYAYTFQDLAVTPSQEVFQMVPLKKGLKIVKWQLDSQPKTRGMGKSRGMLLSQLFSYLEEQPEDFEPSEAESDEPKMRSSYRNYTPKPISRQKVIDNAKSYVNYKFYVNKSNITLGQYLGGKRVITPISKSGYYTAIPYKWGGNDTLSAFQRGLREGKKAGDKCAKKCSGKFIGSPLAVGIDCSGFVTQVWGLKGNKQSTRSLSDRHSKITQKLGSMNDLQAGDILIKPGHVILFSHKDNQGRFYIYEASSDGWNVSGRPYTFSTLTRKKYKPYRYKNIEDGYSGRWGYPKKKPIKLIIYGSQTITERQSSSYTAKVFYDDDSWKEVTKSRSTVWSEKSRYAKFRGSKLYTDSVNQDETLYVKASYRENGKTVAASTRVTIRNATIYSPPPPPQLKIVGNSTLNDGSCANYHIRDNQNRRVRASVVFWSENGRVTQFKHNGRLCSRYFRGFELVRIQAMVLYKNQFFRPSKYIFVK